MNFNFLQVENIFINYINSMKKSEICKNVLKYLQTCSQHET